ncbi:p1/s1 nuclease, putative [Plasmodium vivax]|uniref:P1/s1 nuclease n=6 Tax=Plasmodium vivax TaxID=5855 RepID=A5K1B0_PLAVS|nr:hypothetical protein, conserved [Plasmodium vivax]KMZ78297.1 hypothetical protein PVIIG_02296 [Plasmodium vivax India VII]KMZ83902.1 hypothetical protein PVBG_00982 [Plasmodium vivax Brazil I]KMZ90739.1 hypothetical protein PVMG_02908 [Plasmodium vivax Mauritania I]KMZ97424.1 hypothetical protein PVNG_01254 [Plasmodium vivax North Korean]EDL47107.1 hypothetical protein, conserved [Plasmodium vivax]|eukprot:XP_001616834.1 hypothetical protein [Plasmodium vivax Sal-1]
MLAARWKHCPLGNDSTRAPRQIHTYMHILTSARTPHALVTAMRNPIQALLLCALPLIQRVASWSDEPHMLIAYIAYENLNDNEKATIDRIFAHSHDKDFDNIISAATWPDHIKTPDPRRSHHSFPFERSEILDIFNDWHYVKTPYNPTKVHLPPKHLYGHKGKHNAAGITKHIYRTLVSIKKKPKYGSYYSYNFYLKYFIHLFADIHQPLHTLNFFNGHLINGDKGGNDITVTYGGLNGNIHYLCDSIFNSRRKKWPTVDVQKLKRDATTLMNSFPAHAFRSQLRIPRDKIAYIDTIVHQAYELALEYVYNKLPMHDLSKDKIFPVSKMFVTQLKNVLNHQMVLAGYRLAQYLKDILENVPDDL